jgi:hypothetical protein
MAKRILRLSMEHTASRYEAVAEQLEGLVESQQLLNIKH